MGIGYRGAVIEKEEYTLHPVNVAGGDIYGAYTAAEKAQETGAEVVLLLNDFYMLRNYERPWEPLKQNGVRLVAYIPIDGHFLNTDMVKSCLCFDELVFYSKWALKEVQHAIGKHFYQNDLSPKYPPKLSYIYHGVDTDTFKKPVNHITASHTRKKIFKFDGAEKATIILNANRYNERKDIETTLKAFKEALPYFNNRVYLCLHMPATDEVKKKLLFDRIEDLELTPFVIYNPMGDGYVSDKELCRLYQSCQIGINTSVGEGWGLVSFEHAACGAAQLVPNHTTPGEVWENTAMLIEKSRPVQLHTSPFLMYTVNENTLARRLKLLVNSEDCLQEISNGCYQLTRSGKFNWPTIAAQWEKLLDIRVAQMAAMP